MKAQRSYERFLENLRGDEEILASLIDEIGKLMRNFSQTRVQLPSV
jgi:hypothetical protein